MIVVTEADAHNERERLSERVRLHACREQGIPRLTMMHACGAHGDGAHERIAKQVREASECHREHGDARNDECSVGKADPCGSQNQNGKRSQ